MTLKRLILLFTLLLSACAPAPTTPAPSPTRPPTRAPVMTEPPLQITPSRTPGGPLTLRVWVPPQFDPAQNTPAGQLLRARFDEFARQRPRMSLDVRVKALQGPGGLMDALTTASAAAPEVVPDLIALPRDLLETAALKGLLYPYNAATLSVSEEDWYPYASQLAHLQGSVYGLPFAGDALALVYRPTVVADPPATWKAISEGAYPLAFPAGDPQALFTLTMYQARGGIVSDEGSKPIIETLALTEVLTYYVESQASGVMTDALTQIQSDDQVWTTFVEARAPLAATWTSRYLTGADALNEVVGLAPLPTNNGQPFTLTNGWVWALSSRDNERQRIAVELADFLTQGDFLSTWTEAAGYLPPYPAALQGWENEAARSILDRIARSAHTLPPADILIAISSPLWQATVEVLKKENGPIAAAQKAAVGLAGP